MRARYPDREGYVESHGVPIFYEEYGEGQRAVLFIPPWQILHSRIYKAQIPCFSRHFRVITYDSPGNGRSGRPLSGFDHNRAAADALAVLDATGTAKAALVCSSRSAWQGVILAAEHPERVERLVLSGCALDEGPRAPAFHEMRDRYEGWEKFNAHYWRENFRDFLEFFFGQTFVEPHSTKQWEDAGLVAPLRLSLGSSDGGGTIEKGGDTYGTRNAKGRGLQALSKREKLLADYRRRGRGGAHGRGSTRGPGARARQHA